jgi:hypothetical protein
MLYNFHATILHVHTQNLTPVCCTRFLYSICQLLLWHVSALAVGHLHGARASYASNWTVEILCIWLELLRRSDIITETQMSGNNKHQQQIEIILYCILTTSWFSELPYSIFTIILIICVEFLSHNLMHKLLMLKILQAPWR